MLNNDNGFWAYFLIKKLTTIKISFKEKPLILELLKTSTRKRLDYYKDFKVCDKFGVGKI